MIENIFHKPDRIHSGQRLQASNTNVIVETNQFNFENPH
jgi:hypothetical protein